MTDEQKHALTFVLGYIDSSEACAPYKRVLHALLAAGASDAMDAARYRFLRENMRFSSPRGETPTMTLRAPIPAPTHDIHNDWMGERFDASVDRTIDAALTKEQGNG